MSVNFDEHRDAVRKNYTKKAQDAGCGCSSGSCCSSSQTAPQVSRQLGYTESDLSFVPQGADLGLGCGNPVAIASLKPGQTVLDLGSGGGIDCFLAARAVGRTGRVIGVDMTPEMLRKARTNAASSGHENVEFRLGEIEHLPVADNSVDVIISNCVINLSPEKQQVFNEACRVLKPGGRLAVSDVVLTSDLPVELRNNPELLSGCISGASSISELETMLARAGFSEIAITPKSESREFITNWAPGSRAEDYIQSAVIRAIKAE